MPGDQSGRSLDGGRPLRVAVLASGRGSNLASLLRHIQAGHVDAHVGLVLSDRPDAGALAIARQASVPAVVTLAPEPGETAAAFDVRLLDALEAESPDLVVLAGYLRILGPAIVERFPTVNVHPSLLPAFPGLKAVRQAIRAGVGVAGCTTHAVTADLDRGPILLQAALAVRPGETEASLAARILRLEHIVLPRTVQLVAEGRLKVPRGGTGAQHAAAHDAGDSTSWLHRPGIGLVSGALYSEGF